MGAAKAANVPAPKGAMFFLFAYPGLTAWARLLRACGADPLQSPGFLRRFCSGDVAVLRLYVGILADGESLAASTVGFFITGQFF